MSSTSHTQAAHPWHDAALNSILRALESGRLPHALLVHGLAGLDKRGLAEQIAALVVCRKQTVCGDCAPCKWFKAGNHPDVYRVGPLEDKTTIAVDQIRALSAAMALASHSGDRKVALIRPADRMTEAAANALLKTLEEPSGDSTLILVADRLSALPITIVSRCQSLRVDCPSTEDALAWLATYDAGADWPALLRLTHGAPVAAHDLASDAFSQHLQGLSDDLRMLEKGQADAGTVAARWAKLDAGRCLGWLEQRIGDLIRVRSGTAGRDVAHNLKPADLPVGIEEFNVIRLFRYWDAIGAARRRLDTSLNVQQVLEAVLVPWTSGLIDRATTHG
ncbi:MAG: DNA polymerase III subunit delta' [Pseudomonadota bacterium]